MTGTGLTAVGLLLCCAGGALGFGIGPLSPLGLTRPSSSLCSAGPKQSGRAHATAAAAAVNMRWGESERRGTPTALDAVQVAVKGGFSQLMQLVSAKGSRYASGRPVRPTGFQDRGLAEIDDQDVQSYLQRHGVDTSNWGKGVARSMQDLTAEVRRGESVLSGGQRVIYVVKVQIRDEDHELVEARQIILKNGSIKERNRCLSEKCNPGETPLEAAHRGICEELNDVVGDSPLVKFREFKSSSDAFESEGFSRSFPGLKTRYHFYKVDCEVEGMRRDVTGMKFVTDEGKGRLHEWEWRKVAPTPARMAKTGAPAR
mmetsp:Transcript_46/g.144  ORF Transcript_46/g.144 Transcript_46/m.144 type:complete len:315 (+) Transcript_46:274-1218(+)